MKKLIFSLLALFLLVMSNTGYTATADATATYNVTLQNGCVISNSPSLTIAHSTLNERTDGLFNLEVTCSNGVVYTVTRNGGLHFNNGRRAFNGTNYVKYALCSDSACTNEFGAEGTQSFIGTGGIQNIITYATVRQSENTSAPLGTYTDTLTVYVRW
jgi:spore coat protein U-like protein